LHFVSAGALSLAWVVAALIFLFSRPAPCSYGFDCLHDVNEWGDFWAGTFSPLAFIWLVVAVFLQSMELREQRQELALTRLEFKENRAVAQAQSDESKRQAEFIGEQTKLLQAQESRNKAEESEAIFNAAVEVLVATLINYDHIWYFETDDPTAILHFRLHPYRNDSDRRVVIAAGQHVRKELKTLSQRKTFRTTSPYDFARAFRAVVKALAAYQDLDERSRSLAQALELKRLKSDMESIIGRSFEVRAALDDLGVIYDRPKQ